MIRDNMARPLRFPFLRTVAEIMWGKARMSIRPMTICIIMPVIIVLLYNGSGVGLLRGVADLRR